MDACRSPTVLCRRCRSFVEVVGRAMDEGRVLVRRAATLLGLTVDDLAASFDDHGLATPVSERPGHNDAWARPDGGRTRRRPITGCNKS